jgi:type IV secretory pathway VirB4 component
MKETNGSLTKDLKYWEIHKDVMVLSDGCFVPAIELELLSSDLKSSTELERHNEILSQMLRYAAPEGESLTLTINTRKSDTAITQAYQQQLTAREKIARTITDDRIAHLQDLQSSGRLFEHRAYLSTVYRPSRKRRRNPFNHFLGGKDKYQSLTRMELIQRRSQAHQLRDKLLRYCIQAGFETRPLAAQELFEVPYRYFNPGCSVPTNKESNDYYPRRFLKYFPEFSPATLRRQVAESDLDNNPYDHLWLSGHYVVGLTMEKLPDDVTYPSLISSLLTLPCEKWLILTMEHVPFAAQLNAFKFKARLFRGFTSETGDDVDPTNESSFNTYRQAIAHMNVDNSHVYRIGLTIFIYAKELAEAEHWLEQAQVMASEMQGAKFMRERAGLSKRFRTLAPFAGGMNDIADLVFQENAADFVPLMGPYLGNIKEPDVLYQTRYDTPMGLTVFDGSCKNWNGIIVGATRSGKSFNANDILAGVLRRDDVDAIIIDKGRSFRETVKLYGGAYIEVEKEAINPFDLPANEWQVSEQQLSLLNALYKIMIKSNRENERSEEEALLKAATQQLYRKFTINDGEQKVFKGARLEDLIKILPTMQQVGTHPITPEQRAIANNLVLRLSNWIGRDLKGQFINAATTVDLKARVLCFETAGLENHPDLYEVALMLINHLIWKRLKEDRSRQMFILEDEFAMQLKNPYATAVADEISRTAPKYGAAFWLISQSLKDFDSPVARALLTNTTFHLFYPTPSEEHLIQGLFELPDHTMQLYRTLGGHIGEYREALLMIRKESGVKEGGIVVVRPTPKTYWAYTTHNREVAIKEKIIAKHGVILKLRLTSLLESIRKDSNHEKNATAFICHQ